MTLDKTTAGVLLEQEQDRFGKPRPYTPDHPNLLADGLGSPRVENIPMVSGFPKLLLIFLALVVALYGAYGLISDHLYLPAKRSPGTHYHGIAASLIFSMLICLSCCLITIAISAYDAVQRRMTNQYLLRVLVICGIVFMLAGITIGDMAG